jgi:hypothetical protein
MSNRTATNRVRAGLGTARRTKADTVTCDIVYDELTHIGIRSMASP